MARGTGMPGAGHQAHHDGGGRGRHAGRERGRAPLGELDQDGRDLLGRLALAEHHLGEPRAQVPVGVDVSELERPERQLAQLTHGFVDRSASRLHRLEQRSQTQGVHAPLTIAPVPS